MSCALNRQKLTKAARRRISDFEDVRSVSESIQRGDAVLVVSVYPWGLEFEVEAAGTTMSDFGEDGASA